MNKKIIVIIGARSKSKSIKDKNLLLINNIPLLAWPIVIAKQCKNIDKIYLSTDSVKYGKIGECFGAEFILRPPGLAQDNSVDYDWIRDLMITPAMIWDDDMLVLLRPTSPLRNPKILEDVIKKFDDKNYDSLRTIEELLDPIEKLYEFQTDMKTIQRFRIGDKYPVHDMPRQECKKIYRPNGYADILKVETIRKYGNLFGNKVQGYITPKILEIDEYDDYELVKGIR